MTSPSDALARGSDSHVRYGRVDKRARKIEEINETAAEIFIRDGYFEFSARKVAKEIGISLSNLQHYCGNTENLRLQMIKAKLEHYVIRFNEICNNTNITPIDRLDLAIRENVAATLYPYTGSLFFQMAALATQDASIKEVMIEQYEHFLAGLRKLIEDINSDLNPEQVSTYSGLIAAQIEGNFFYQWQPSLTLDIRERMIDTAVVFWRALLLPPPLQVSAAK